uniref:hypothetical protein n=1 Tax=uncultured Limnohabitans sp. TaxID=768543 RepID=UPI00262A76CF
MGGRSLTGLQVDRTSSGPQNTLLQMGSEMTPGVDEEVNQHGLVVKLINHTGLANQALSEMSQTQGPKFLKRRSTFGVFPDVTQ